MARCRPPESATEGPAAGPSEPRPADRAAAHRHRTENRNPTPSEILSLSGTPSLTENLSENLKERRPNGSCRPTSPYLPSGSYPRARRLSGPSHPRGRNLGQSHRNGRNYRNGPCRLDDQAY